MADWLTTIVTNCCLLITIFYIWAKWKLSYWQRRGVPTPSTNILFGNFSDSVFFRTPPAYLLGNLSNSVPDAKFLGVYIFHKPFLLINDLKLIKQMFVKDFDVFSNRYFQFSHKTDIVGTHNLFSTDNPEWRHLRHKLSPAFSSAKLKSLFKLIVASSESLRSHMEKQFKDEPTLIKTIDVKDASSRYTTDIISSLAFGVQTDSFDRSTAEFYDRVHYVFRKDFFGALVNYGRFFFPNIVGIFSFSTLLGKNTDYFRSVVRSSIEAREKAKLERGDIIDNLIKLKNGGEDGKLDFHGDVLVAQSVIFLIAGLETSSTTISFALYELAKQPEIQEAARKEIIEELGSGELTYDCIHRMKYLMQIIYETLRMYPPAPLIDRYAQRNYKIPGTDVTIEKGTPVYVVLPGLHMNSEYFPNPHLFDPGRFDESNKVDSYPYMPFGEGPRTCIGMRIGMLQTAVGLIRMLQNYRVSINPSHTVRVSRHSVFVKPEAGVNLNFEKILD